MTAYFEEELVPDLPLAQDTTAQKFVAFDAANPGIYVDIVAAVMRRIRAGAKYISMKGVFEELRGWSGAGVRLNNTYTAFYTDKVIEGYPWTAPYFHRRRRADRPMRLVTK